MQRAIRPNNGITWYFVFVERLQADYLHISIHRRDGRCARIDNTSSSAALLLYLRTETCPEWNY